MPNPNFTGTVPHRRCETCVHWDRHHESSRHGVCLDYSLGSEVRPTTDLTVCSNWTAKVEPE